MPLYNLWAVSRHYAQYAPIRNLTIVFVKTGGGLVRDIKFWGRKNLAQVTTKRKVGDGDHWTMQFDCNPPTLFALRERLKRDPRMIRYEIQKVGEGLQSSTRISEYMGTFGPSDSIFIPKTEIQADKAAKLDAILASSAESRPASEADPSTLSL